MTAALLRPELTVITRTLSRVTAARMHEFGTPTVVNPFDRFGDHLRLALRSPASYQLLSWLEAGPGSPLPERADPPQHGRWVMCGYGRFGRELTADLEAGNARAILGQAEVHPDVDRIIAVYPDGRAFGWHQLNDKTPERGVMD